MPAWFNLIYLVPILLLSPLAAAALTRMVGNLIGASKPANGEEAAAGSIISLVILLVAIGSSLNSTEIASWSEFYQAVLLWAFGGVISMPVMMIVHKIALMAFKAVISGVDRVCRLR